MVNMKKKGIAEIMTTFFLLIVMVGVAIAFVSFNKGFLLLQHKINKELEDYTTAYLIRQQLSSCFGLAFDQDLVAAKTCSDGSLLNLDILSDLIKGYNIHQTNHYGCAETDWKWSGSDQMPETELRYFVPIKNPVTNLVCLGELTIYI